jgi:hypothetical protein
MALSPHEFVLALKAGMLDYLRAAPGVSIGGQYIVGQYVPVVAGVPVSVRVAA